MSSKHKLNQTSLSFHTLFEQLLFFVLFFLPIKKTNLLHIKLDFAVTFV